MEKARGELRKSTDLLLHLIRTKFPEIDIQEISDAAGAKYDAQMAEMEQRLAGKAKAIERIVAKGYKTNTDKSKVQKKAKK
jgi:hypothetical protein